MGKWFRTLAWISVVLGALLAGLHYTFLDWWTVPSDDPQLGASISPTLYPGDFVLLWRKTPAFGDLARCADPEAPGRHVIGRVVGEPRDVVETEQFNVTVNNKRGIQEHSCTPDHFTIQDPSTGADVELYCGVEALVQHKHTRGISSKSSSHAPPRKHTVGEGHLFLLSDNRVYPLDSRTYGAVPKESCKEFIFFRLVGAKGWGDPRGRLSFIN